MHLAGKVQQSTLKVPQHPGQPYCDPLRLFESTPLYPLNPPGCLHLPTKPVSRLELSNVDGLPWPVVCPGSGGRVRPVSLAFLVQQLGPVKAATLQVPNGSASSYIWAGHVKRHLAGTSKWKPYRTGPTPNIQPTSATTATSFTTTTQPHDTDHLYSIAFAGQKSPSIRGELVAQLGKAQW